MHALPKTAAALIGCCNATIGWTSTDFPKPTFSMALVKSSDFDWPGLRVTVRAGPIATPWLLAKLRAALQGLGGKAVAVRRIVWPPAKPCGASEPGGGESPVEVANTAPKPVKVSST